MQDYVTFDARVEPMVWGKSTYTILRVPDHIVDALGKTRRVEGEVNDHPINLAITRAPVIDSAFLWAGKAFLAETGLEPGEITEVRLRPAPDDLVEVPPDVTDALRSAGATEVWEALTPGKRRGLLHQVTSAKRAETRVKRISALVASLRNG